jgi:hypothetical protein
MNVSLPSSGTKSNLSKQSVRKNVSACCLILTGWSLGLLFDPEDGGSILLCNVGELLSDTRHNIPEDSSLIVAAHENVKSILMLSHTFYLLYAVTNCTVAKFCICRIFSKVIYLLPLFLKMVF